MTQACQYVTTKTGPRTEPILGIIRLCLVILGYEEVLQTGVVIKIMMIKTLKKEGIFYLSNSIQRWEKEKTILDGLRMQGVGDSLTLGYKYFQYEFGLVLYITGPTMQKDRSLASKFSIWEPWVLQRKPKFRCICSSVGEKGVKDKVKRSSVEIVRKQNQLMIPVWFWHILFSGKAPAIAKEGARDLHGTSTSVMLLHQGRYPGLLQRGV